MTGNKAKRAPARTNREARSVDSTALCVEETASAACRKAKTEFLRVKKALGFSTADTALLIGVSATTINRWMSVWGDRHLIPAGARNRLAAFCGMNRETVLDFLFRLKHPEDEIPPHEISASADTSDLRQKTDFEQNRFSWLAGIKSLRKRLLLSQSELADLIGVAQGTVSKWEQSKSTPSASQLIALAYLQENGVAQTKKLLALLKKTPRRESPH